MLTASILSLCSKAYAFCPLCVFGAGVGAAEAVRTGDIFKIGVWCGGLLLTSVYFFSEKRVNTYKYKLLICCIISFALALVLSAAGGLIYGLLIPVMQGISVIPETVIKTGLVLFKGGALGIAGAFTASYAACILLKALSFRIPFLRLMLVLTVLALLG